MAQGVVDFVVLAPLREERDALLKHLPGHTKLPPSSVDTRVYYAAKVPVAFPGSAEASYTVIVLPLAGMGHTEAANATSDAIRRWHPRYVMLTGIAGGLRRAGIRLGDVLISEQVVDYEVQKIVDGVARPRWQVHRADQRLLIAAQNFEGTAWAESLDRPDRGEPRVHFGPICTGNKVIADESLAEQLRDVWQKLIGVEMEAGGVASAAFQSSDSPGFFMIRGVSDLADPDKDGDKTVPWRPYACEVAAAYTVGFLRSGPVPAGDERPLAGPRASVSDPRSELAALNVPFSAASLMDRIAEGDARAVNLLLDAGMNPNTKGSDHRTALEHALKHGDTSIVAALLAHGADVVRETNPLVAAARSNRFDIARLLVESGRLPASALADALDIAAHRAVEAPDDNREAGELLRSLLERGAPEQLAGTQLLHSVAAGKHAHLVELLLRHGADPNFVDSAGQTPLGVAIERGRFDNVGRLLDAGADPNVGTASLTSNADVRGTNLMLAAWKRNPEIVRALLEKGASVNAVGHNGLTALMIAAHQGDRSSVGYLLDRGANALARRADGKTAREMADKPGRDAIMLLLRTAEEQAPPGPTLK
jgi:ankyrin repeat protein/nucleoside phosphorylase